MTHTSRYLIDHEPAVGAPLGTEEVIEAISGTQAVVFDPSGDEAFARALADAARWDELAVVIGPEAGVAGGGLAAARAADAPVCHLGDATLRAQRAALVAVRLALAATGHLDRESTPAST